MRVARAVRVSLRVVLRHRVRAALAVSATAVGVAALLVLMSIGEGARREIEARIDALGRNMLVVNAADAPRPVSRARTARRMTTLRLEDVEPLLAASPSVSLAAPAQDRGRVVRYERTNTMATVRATTPEWMAIRDFALSEGRFFTHEENEGAARVGVIGSDVRETLFADADALGRTVFVGRVPIRVIGVLESKGLTVDGLSEEDNQVVVPIRTGLRRLFNVDYLASIYVEVAEGAGMDQATTEIASVLRDRHDLARLGRQDDFTIQDQALLLHAEAETAASFRRVLNTLGATALAVGGVGILSVMLLAVKERTGEIGLRLAVGAKRRDVLLQFLAESTMLALSGGLGGLLIGRAVAWTLARTTHWTTAVGGTTVVLALGSALLLGVGFGAIPAARAARLDPIDALRSG